MDKEYILSELKRTAAENGGPPLGIDRFREATGIRKEDWYGIHWTKWSDAQMEAGLPPNQFGEDAFDEDWMLEQIAALTRTLGHIPTKPECKMQKRKAPDFPNSFTIRRRLGKRPEMIARLEAFCAARKGWHDVVAICTAAKAGLYEQEQREPEPEQMLKAGHVYMLKHDNAYKIGHSIDASRRYKEIRVQMPHTTEEVHVIETDDAVGIEAYWHNRFRDKRLGGEWFQLSAADVRAFKKRRFM